MRVTIGIGQNSKEAPIKFNRTLEISLPLMIVISKLWCGEQSKAEFAEGHTSKSLFEIQLCRDSDYSRT